MTTVFGVEVLFLLAFALLVGGVVGSVVPLVPGAGLSLAGVLLYWWHSGYAEPQILVLIVLVLGGLFAIVFDWAGEALATHAGGGSPRTTIAAGLAGFALFFVAGPLGIVVGVGATVFALEYLGGSSTRASARTAAYATAGVLASAVVQLLITLSILVVMVVVVLL